MLRLETEQGEKKEKRFVWVIGVANSKWQTAHGTFMSYYHQTTFWHFWNAYFFATCPERRQLWYFQNKCDIDLRAVLQGHLREIGTCTIAAEARTTFWQNCGECHKMVTLDAIIFHSGTSEIAQF